MVGNLTRSDNLDILMVTDNNLENIVGGAEESLRIICRGLGREFKIGIIQPGPVSRKIADVSYFCVTADNRLKSVVKNPRALIRFILAVKETISVTNPRVVHTNLQISFFIVAFLKKLGIIPKHTHLIHTERGLYVKYNSLIRFVFFFCMTELNTLVTTTEFNARLWKEKLEKKKLPISITVIENTAGELFESIDEGTDKSDRSQVVIGFAGRYARWKNWPLALDISERLNDVLGDTVMVKMAVGCLDEESLMETRAMFERLKDSLGDRFDGRVNLSIEEMNQFYYDVDIFILTSEPNTESFGSTLVEAMSRKTVVLTTNSGGKETDHVQNPTAL